MEAAGLVADIIIATYDVRDMESGNGVGVGPDIAVAEEGATSVATVTRHAFKTGQLSIMRPQLWLYAYFSLMAFCHTS